MIKKAIYNDIYKILRGTSSLFVRGRKSIEINNGVFVHEEFELFKSSFYPYIYTPKFLSVFNSKTCLFDKSYTNSQHLLGSLNKEDSFLLFEQNSDLIRVYQSYEEKESFRFDKNISLWINDIVVTTTGKSLTKRNRLEIYDFKNQKNLIWSYELSEGFWFFGELQVVDGVLICTAHTRGNKEKKITGLNINTGEILWELNYKVPYRQNLVALHFNEDDNLCYGLSKNYYQIFNPITGKVISEKLTSDFLPEGVSPVLNKQSIYNGVLWFVCGKGQSVQFGAINIKKAEFEFIQNNPLDGDDQFDIPIYHEGELYLRTLHGNALHVFEKE